MPTGYTDKIKDGISFEEFALTCARAFGAAIDMLDLPADEPISSEIKVGQYHKDALKKAKMKLDELDNMGPTELRQTIFDKWAGTNDYHQERIWENDELRKKYNAMLDKSRAFVSPSPEHDAFKEFMIKQIESSIQFDCDNEYHRKAIAANTKMSITEYRIHIRKILADSVLHHQKEYDKAVESAEDKNEWIKLLRGAIK